MKPIDRVVFFGTPQFSISTLVALANSRYRPTWVVTQPRRPSGRGRRLQDPPVARWATEAGIEVRQPAKVRDEEFLADLESLEADVAVVVAFGQIFPQKLLDLPRLGCVNLHGSLLPRFRGAAPIQAAIAEGVEETGVTTMRMEAGLDSGPILLQRSTRIEARETAAVLAERLARSGGELMMETLRGIEDGSLEPQEQDHEQATYAPRLKKTDGIVEWTRTAAEIDRRFRAFQPWPGLMTTCRGRDLKLVEVEALSRREDDRPPGSFLGLDDDGLRVACADGSVLGIRRVQRPGRRVVEAREFCNGERLVVSQQEFSFPEGPAHGDSP